MKCTGCVLPAVLVLYVPWHTCLRTRNEKNLHIHQFFGGTGRFCISFNVWVWVSTRHGSREEAISTRQLPWDTAQPSHVTRVTTSHPEVTFLCLLIYHLHAAHRWLYSFYPYWNTKGPPGTTKVCACVCICHTAACRGLSQSTETSLSFSIQVCFHPKEPSPSNRDKYDQNTVCVHTEEVCLR